jgi:hypothetical protein
MKLARWRQLRPRVGWIAPALSFLGAAISIYSTSWLPRLNDLEALRGYRNLTCYSARYLLILLEDQRFKPKEHPHVFDAVREGLRAIRYDGIKPPYLMEQFIDLLKLQLQAEDFFIGYNQTSDAQVPLSGDDLKVIANIRSDMKADLAVINREAQGGWIERYLFQRPDKIPSACDV